MCKKEMCHSAPDAVMFFRSAHTHVLLEMGRLGNCCERSNKDNEAAAFAACNHEALAM